MGEAGDCDAPERKKPHFFKVLLESSREELGILQRIPPAFARHIKNKSSLAILKSLVVKRWPVELAGDGDRLVFRSGWKDFFNFHSLKEGDFLIFRYNGNMQFIVCVFGRSCCEDNYALTEVHVEGASHLRQPVRLPSQNPAHRYFNASENAGSVEQLSPSCGSGISRERGETVRKSRVEAPIQSKSSLSSKPSFGVVMKQHGGNIQKYVHIPVDFGRTLEELLPFRNLSLHGAVKLPLYNQSDPSVEACKVRLLHRLRYKADTYTISAGWVRFCRRSKLKPGDMCIFELNNERSGINMYVNRH